MPRNTCDFCCNPRELSRNPETYHAAHLEILCAILAAVGGAPGDETRYDWELLCDPLTNESVFVRFEYNTAGVVIGSAAFLPNGTPYLGNINDLVACSGEDLEYLDERVEFCALVDSPINYPNPGDPAGTAYSQGDRILVQIAAEVSNLLAPVAFIYKNLSNSTYPTPFYFQYNGVDIVGTFPDNADFAPCDQAVLVPQTPVIDAAPFLGIDAITGVPFMHGFNVPLKGVSVWNGGSDFILAELTTAPVTTGGNRQLIIPPGGTAQVQIAVSTPELITQVELSTLNGGICPAIVNAVHPGGV